MTIKFGPGVLIVIRDGQEVGRHKVRSLTLQIATDLKVSEKPHRTDPLQATLSDFSDRPATLASTTPKK